MPDSDPRHERDEAIRAEVRKTIAYHLQCAIDGNELLMKEVWEQCWSETEREVAETELVMIKTLVERAGEPNNDKVAIAAYQMFMSATRMLIARSDTTSAKNYVEIKLVGIPAPFDRLVVELIREHGMTPGEIAHNNKRVAEQVIDALRNIAANVVTIKDLADFKAEAEKTLQYAIEQRARLV